MWAYNEGVCKMNEEILKKLLPELRRLRLWHWEGVLYRRNAAKFYEDGKSKTSYEKAKDCANWQHEQANFHLKQVQLLNSFFEVYDTAERDLQNKRV